MKKSSYLKEQVYQHLISELSEKNSAAHSYASSSKWIRLFCMYLANYTVIKEIDQVDKASVQQYFTYLLDNHKRLSLSLTDIKKSMQMIEEILDIEVGNSLNDFSLSNTSLWKNLK
jgi:site-specific recombinase XerD